MNVSLKEFEITECEISGVLLIEPKIFEDRRGRFVKTFQSSVFEKLGLVSLVAEDFFTISNKGSLRGLHFQVPPFEHEKLVTCLHGRVLDLCLDLRSGSKTYGQHVMFDLDGNHAKSVFMPKGIAHGFYTVSEQAWVAYKTTSEYSPQHDQGVRWNSVNIPWPDLNPILSDRDQKLPLFQNFKSPF